LICVIYPGLEINLSCLSSMYIGLKKVTNCKPLPGVTEYLKQDLEIHHLVLPTKSSIFRLSIASFPTPVPKVLNSVKKKHVDEHPL